MFKWLLGVLALGAAAIVILVYPRQPSPGIEESRGFCADIHARVCGARGMTMDPTGYVRNDVDGELQALRLYEEIIHQDPEGSVDQHETELVQRIYAEKRRSRIEAAFRWTRTRLVALIERQPESVFSAGEKRELRQRIRAVHLDLPATDSAYRDDPGLYTRTDVVYERMTNGHTRLRVGGAYLFTVTSWFNVVFTLTHELAHAIDPCETRGANLSFPAFDRLSACLMNQGVVATEKTRRECGDDDQLSEAVVDWLAVQITSEALAQFATEFDPVQLEAAAVNSVRDLCAQDDAEDDADTTLHPAPEIRIERIFGRNPRIQALLGCQPERVPATAGQIYCDFQSMPSGPVQRIKASAKKGIRAPLDTRRVNSSPR